MARKIIPTNNAVIDIPTAQPTNNLLLPLARTSGGHQSTAEAKIMTSSERIDILKGKRRPLANAKVSLEATVLDSIKADKSDIKTIKKLRSVLLKYIPNILPQRAERLTEEDNRALNEGIRINNPNKSEREL